jgi:hypothetical protein
MSRAVDSAGTSGLVTFECRDGVLQCGAGTEKGGAATGDNTFFDGCTCCTEGIFDAVLLFLELDLGGCADLDHGNAARELGKTLLELLAIPVGIAFFDLALDLGDTTVDVGGFAGAFNDGGLVLGHDDLAGGAQKIECRVVELESDFLGDDSATGEDGHVGEHCLAALSEARGLDGDGAERAADLVHDERGKSLAVDVLGDDQQRLARLHDLLEHGKHVLH